MHNVALSRKLIDDVSNVMQINQEIRILLTSFTNEENKIFEMLNEHNDAIDNLIDVLIGTAVGLKRILGGEVLIV